MTAELVVFYALAALVAISALCVVVPPFARNPLHAAMALLIALFGLSGIYVLLSAHLVAELQVLVYAGAVMVLFTFVIMLLHLRKEELAGAHLSLWKALGLAAAVVFAGKVGAAAWSALSHAPMATVEMDGAAGFGGVRDVAVQLLTRSFLAFEMTSVLLLVAIVGAVMIVHRRRGDVP